MKRVAVVGVTGSGKTTLARVLSARLDVPWVELDALYWGPNWTPPSDRDAFRAKIAAHAAEEGWIIEGNYSIARDLVWSAADTLVWLDYPLKLILWRLLSRTIRRGLRREILWGTNQERLWTQFLSPNSLFLWAWQTFPKYRREYPELLASPKYAHLHVIRLGSPDESRAWLAGVSSAESR